MKNRIYKSLVFHLNDEIYKLYDKKVNEKIVIIESDDWGSIRMPSKETFNSLSTRFNLASSHYSSNDSLVTNADISNLLEVLDTVKDKNGMSCKLTANFLTANPDYSKIVLNDYQQYYSESIIDSYNKTQDVNFSTIINACNSGMIVPQLHGREHVNVLRWMGILQSGNKDIRFACKNSVSGLSNFFLEAYGIDNVSELEEKNARLITAAHEFESIFGFKSKSFVAPNYCWSSLMNETLKKSGIELIQSIRNQNDFITRKKQTYHYIGQTNQFGQKYSIRNVNFEPSSNKKINWVDHTLSSIEHAFKNNYPAVISSHRVNYVSRINESNRDNCLFQLKLILSSIVKKWPTVQFLSSDQLIKYL